MRVLVVRRRMVVVMMLERRIRDHGVESRGFGNQVANYSCHVIVSRARGGGVRGRQLQSGAARRSSG